MLKKENMKSVTFDPLELGLAYKYKSALDSLSDMVLIMDRERKILYLNPAFEKVTGIDRKEALGMLLDDLLEKYRIVPKGEKDKIIERTKKGFEKGKSAVDKETIMINKEGNEFPVSYSASIIRHEGEVIGQVVIIRDITERKKLEEKLRETIEKLKASQEELSTPVVKVWEGIIMLPVIGVVDSYRAQRMMETLLERIVETDAHVVILDITGVATMDSEVINYILKTVKAAELMGAECVITGIKPEIAQAIVRLGFDASSLVVKRDVEDALRYSLGRIGIEIGGKQ